MKHYFSYFKVMFIIIGILAIITGGVGIAKMSEEEITYVRANHSAPTQRVFDYADKLTDTEEQKLEKLIAEREAESGCDLVLVIIKESLYKKYGIVNDTDSNWEYCMMNYADDFYDENLYGFNKIHGDGALLLDNWYPGEKGSWLSTCGKVYDHYTQSMIDTVLDDVYNKVEDNPYMAYKTYINNVCDEMTGKSNIIKLPISLIICVPAVAALIFRAKNLKNKSGTKTTTATTYVEQGSVKFNVQKDELVNKYVTSRPIPQVSSGGGSGGRAGGHTSRGGVSHGGGGRRR